MKVRTMFRACNAAAAGYKPGVGSRKPGRSHTGPLWSCSCCGAPIRVRHCGLSGLTQRRRRRARVCARLAKTSARWTII